MSIENAPDRIVQRLRKRAERHQRSLQGGLLAITEAAALEETPATPAEIPAEVRRLVTLDRLLAAAEKTSRGTN